MSVFDKNEDETENTTTTNYTATKDTPNIIIGREHVFKLTCLPIPEGGVQRYALAETGIQLVLFCALKQISSVIVMPHVNLSTLI